MGEAQFYDRICKDRFDKIDERFDEQNSRFDRMEGKMDDIHNCLKGDDKQPGVFERMRAIEKTHKRILGVCGAVVIMLLTQLAVWLRQRFGG